MKPTDKLSFAVLIFSVAMIVNVVFMPKEIGFNSDFIGWAMVLLGLGSMCGSYLIQAWKENKQEFNPKA